MRCNDGGNQVAELQRFRYLQQFSVILLSMLKAGHAWQDYSVWWQAPLNRCNTGFIHQQATACPVHAAFVQSYRGVWGRLPLATEGDSR
jgi:hypothetical protein